MGGGRINVKGVVVEGGDGGIEWSKYGGTGSGCELARS